MNSIPPKIITINECIGEICSLYADFKEMAGGVVKKYYPKAKIRIISEGKKMYDIEYAITIDYVIQMNIYADDVYICDLKKPLTDTIFDVIAVNEEIFNKKEDFNVIAEYCRHALLITDAVTWYCFSKNKYPVRTGSSIFIGYL